MRWKAKTKPKHGDVRIVRKFLFLKREFYGECRWLEWAEIEEHYIIEHDKNHFLRINSEGWVEKRFYK